MLSELASCSMALLVSNAECERGVSPLKRTKTTLRNQLSTKNIDAILQITLNGRVVNISTLPRLLTSGEDIKIVI